MKTISNCGWALALTCTVACTVTDAPGEANDDGGSTGGASTGSGTETGTVDGGTGTTGDTEGTGESTTTGATACSESAECPAESPICEDDVCVPCTASATPDEACAAVDAAAPACGADGQCVQCSATMAAACEGTTPACDAATNTCVGCSEHAQCPASACDFRDGSCLGGTMLQVGPGLDYETPTLALATLEAGDTATLVIHPAEGEAAYQAALTINGDLTVAMIGADGRPLLQAAGNAPAVTIAGGALVFMEGLEISHGDSLGVRIDAATAYIDRTEIIDNNAGGVLVDSEGVLRLRNSAVSGESLVALAVPAGTAEVVYGTLVGGANDAAAVTCGDASTVTIRNSIVVTQTAVDELACAGATVTHTLSETEIEGEGNATVDVAVASMFASLDTSDYHLSDSGAAAAAGVALREAGDPSVDLDADARPAVGETDHAGADVP